MKQSAERVYGDRRAVRRRETIAEILDVAVEVMAEEGVAALSLAEVARRMGMRPPSLYQYFPSKMAIYDELFGAGYRETNAELTKAIAGIDDPLAAMRAAGNVWVSWCMANPVLAQIMYTRTVPGFEPSPESYAPSVEQLDGLRMLLRNAVAAGQLRSDAATEDGVALYTSLTGGLISQQFANEPDAPVEKGRYSRLIQKALDMFFEFYAPRREDGP
jgi:AcrR family transcriptional regulator